MITAVWILAREGYRARPGKDYVTTWISEDCGDPEQDSTSGVSSSIFVSDSLVVLFASSALRSDSPSVSVTLPSARFGKNGGGICECSGLVAAVAYSMSPVFSPWIPPARYAGVNGGDSRSMFSSSILASSIFVSTGIQFAVFQCVRRPLAAMYLRLHFGHRYGLSLVCRRRCSFRCTNWTNFEPQILQRNGLSPLCSLMCVLRFDVDENLFAQTSQACGFSPVWTRLCFCK